MQTMQSVKQRFPVKELPATIQVPKEFNWITRENRPSREYREAQIRDFVIAKKGQTITGDEFSKELGMSHAGALGIVQKLVERGRLARQRVTTLVDGKAHGFRYIYEWINNPVPVVNPKKFEENKLNGAPKTKSLFRADDLKRIEIIRTVLRNAPRTARSAPEWGVIIGTGKGSWTRLKRLLVPTGILLEEGKGTALRAYTWNETAYQWVIHGKKIAPTELPEAPEPISASPAIEQKDDAPTQFLVQPEIVAARSSSPTEEAKPVTDKVFDKMQVFRSFVDWIDSEGAEDKICESPDYLAGALAYRRYLEKRTVEDDNR